jgi:hypothetical protein
VVRYLYATDEERKAMELPATARLTRPLSEGFRITEVDRAVARKLGVLPAVIPPAAHRLWRRNLDEERDRRVGDPAASAQKRGRVTRGLVRELAATLKGKRRSR